MRPMKIQHFPIHHNIGIWTNTHIIHIYILVTVIELKQKFAESRVHMNIRNINIDDQLCFYYFSTTTSSFHQLTNIFSIISTYKTFPFTYRNINKSVLFDFCLLCFYSLCPCIFDTCLVILLSIWFIFINFVLMEWMIVI